MGGTSRVGTAPTLLIWVYIEPVFLALGIRRAGTIDFLGQSHAGASKINVNWTILFLNSLVRKSLAPKKGARNGGNFKSQIAKTLQNFLNFLDAAQELWRMSAFLCIRIRS